MSQYPRQQGGYRSDELGTTAPLGHSGGEKELLRLPSEAEKTAPAAATMARARIQEKLRGHYGLAASLAGDHKPTLAFIYNMMGAGLGVGGFARNEYLMGLSRMPVPSAMPVQSVIGNDGRPRALPEPRNRGKNGSNEEE